MKLPKTVASVQFLEVWPERAPMPSIQSQRTAVPQTSALDCPPPDEGSD